MKAEEVVQYLQNHPQFFEDHAAMLAEIAIPHPYGGRTVSLSERQMLTLREKNKELEKQLQELVEHARDNDALQQKTHRYTLTLFGAENLLTQQDAITQGLREIFEVPHVALHVWKGLPPSAEVLSFADQQMRPVCTHHALHDTQSWFNDAAPHLHSFAYLPLRSDEHSVGLLILASEDPQRFYPEMGTVFLQRIAETAAAALKPWL
jgi:uncharacterized protein YigA (DUF484 family)